MLLSNSVKEILKDSVNRYVRGTVSTSVTLSTRTDSPLDSPWITIYVLVWGEVSNKINVELSDDIR